MDIVAEIATNWWIFGAIIGSFLLWKFYGSRIVLKYAGLALERWIERAYKDPEGHESKVVGKLAALIIAHLLENVDDVLPADPTQPAHPSVNLIFRRLEDHLMKAMSAAFGRQIRRIGEAAENADDPANALQMAFPAMGGDMDGLTQMMTMLQMFNKAGGNKGSGFL